MKRLIAATAALLVLAAGAPALADKNCAAMCARSLSECKKRCEKDKECEDACKSNDKVCPEMCEAMLRTKDNPMGMQGEMRKIYERQQAAQDAADDRAAAAQERGH
jgi:hypothetical protein